MIARIIFFCIAFFLWIVSADAAARFAVCTVTCTWDNSSTAMWSTTSGGSTGAAAPTTSDDVTFDGSTCVGGVTCTITPNANITVRSITFGACTASTTGCILDFSVNNNNLAISNQAGFSGTGTGTRVLRLGSGTHTITSGAGGTPWNFSTTTNLTFTAGTSTLVFAGNNNGLTFNGGGLTYNNVSLTSTFTNINGWTVNGSNTFATLTIAAPNSISLPGSGTQTVTSLVATGSSGSVIYLWTTSSNGSTISSASNQTLQWVAPRQIAFTGGGTFVCNSCFDLGINSGITLNGPTAGGGRIIGGWLLGRDLGYANDNAPMFIRAVA